MVRDYIHKFVHDMFWLANGFACCDDNSLCRVPHRLPYINIYMIYSNNIIIAKKQTQNTSQHDCYRIAHQS